MSENNVEIAREAIEAWNAGDMERLGALYDADAVYRTPSDWVGGPWTGREAIIEQFRDLWDVWPDDTSFGVPEFRDAGQRVAVRVPWHSATRGLALTTDVNWVYTMRDGLIVSLEFFHSWEEALEAAGLSE
jgi:ketosteroid isomerase-like protein